MKLWTASSWLLSKAMISWRKNALCLYEHKSKHGKEEKQGVEKQDEHCSTTTERKRVPKPRIKIIENDEQISLLVSLIKFYDQDSNVRLESETTSLPLKNSTDWLVVIGIHPKKNFEINSKVSDVSDLSSTNFCHFFGQDEYFELELNTIANWPFSEDIH